MTYMHLGNDIFAESSPALELVARLDIQRPACFG